MKVYKGLRRYTMRCITLASFHSLGKTAVSIELVNISVKDGPTISAAIFRSLQGIWSRPEAFFSLISDNSLQTTLMEGGLIQKLLFVGVKYDSGSLSVTGTSCQQSM